MTMMGLNPSQEEELFLLAEHYRDSGDSEDARWTARFKLGDALRLPPGPLRDDALQAARDSLQQAIEGGSYAMELLDGLYGKHPPCRPYTEDEYAEAEAHEWNWRLDNGFLLVGLQNGVARWRLLLDSDWLLVSE